MMNKKIIEPKDLGIKFGSEREALWTHQLKNAEAVIKQDKAEIEVYEEMIEVCKRIIAEEKAKI